MLLASLVEAFQEDARRLDDDLHVSILDFIEQVEVADDLTPLTMEKMNKVAKSLRRALNDRKVAPTPKPLASTTAKLARFETKNAASVSKATSAPKGLGEEEIGEERETRAPYNVTSVLSGGMVG